MSSWAYCSGCSAALDMPSLKEALVSHTQSCHSCGSLRTVDTYEQEMVCDALEQRITDLESHTQELVKLGDA